MFKHVPDSRTIIFFFFAHVCTDRRWGGVQSEYIVTWRSFCDPFFLDGCMTHKRWEGNWLGTITSARVKQSSQFS